MFHNARDHSPLLLKPREKPLSIIYRANMILRMRLVEHHCSVINQIKSNQINFIGIKSSHRTVTSHMYTVTQEQSQT